MSPLFLFGNPAVDLGGEHVHGYGTIAQYLAVEFAHVEPSAERRLRPGAQCRDVQLAELVAERLARPHDVALHFGSDVTFGHRRVVEHVLDRLLARPTLGM